MPISIYSPPPFFCLSFKYYIIHITAKECCTLYIIRFLCAVIRCLVIFDSLWPHGEPTRLFCPWNFPGKNTGVDCHFLLQGILLTQGSNPSLLSLLRWQVDSLPLEPPYGYSLISDQYCIIHSQQAAPDNSPVWLTEQCGYLQAFCLSASIPPL